jgi:hypothetical protein
MSRTHLLSHTVEHKAWVEMRQRCQNLNHRKYYRYGARGIKVCKRWDERFEAFYKDMGTKPERKNFSLERVDLDGDYEPANCVWASAKVQANNRSTNHPITYNGRTQNLCEWAKELGINHQTLSQRIHVYGWSTDKALSTPVGKRS